MNSILIIKQHKFNGAFSAWTDSWSIAGALAKGPGSSISLTWTSSVVGGSQSSLKTPTGTQGERKHALVPGLCVCVCVCVCVRVCVCGPECMGIYVRPCMHIYVHTYTLAPSLPLPLCISLSLSLPRRQASELPVRLLARQSDRAPDCCS